MRAANAFGQVDGYRSVTSAHAGDPRRHRERGVAATTSPTCRSRRSTAPPTCSRRSRTCGPASPSADKDPRKSLHVGEVPTPELAPDEAYVAVMASSINFNTVWTQHLRAAADVRLRWPASAGERVGRAPRPAVPGGRQRRRRRRAAGRLGGAQLEAGRPGHRALQLRRRPGPDGARRLDDGQPTSGSGATRPTSAASPTSPWSRPTSCMPKPAHLTWEEAAVNALCNSTSYRMLVSQQRGAR